MTNPQTPTNPQGPQQKTGEAPQQPPFAPQPTGQQPGPPGGSPQQAQHPPQHVAQGQYVDGGYAQQYPQQQYPQAQNPQPQYPQPQYDPQPQYPQPQYAPAPRPQRPARTVTDKSAVPYGVGPFTLREAWFLGAGALVLLASFLPFVGGEYADVFGYTSAWAPAPWLAVPAALVLVSAAALLVLRRLLPGRLFRVGSLSVDQFASAASLATAGFYLGTLFFLLGFPAWFGGGSQLLVPGVGVIVGLLFSLLAVVLTTLAPAIPLFRREFSGRQDVTSHPVARPATAVPVRPRQERPAAPQQPAGYAGYPGQPGVPMQPAGPGEFAAYSRRRSQPAPAYDPEATFPPAEGSARPAPDTVPADEPEARRGSAETTGEAPHEPQTFGPGSVATRIPAVDPDGVASAPDRSGHPGGSRDDTVVESTDRAGSDRAGTHPPRTGVRDVDEVDEVDDVDEVEVDEVDEVDAGQVEPAPVSAFSHVSARAATAPAGVTDAGDADRDAVRGHDLGAEEHAVAPAGENTTANTTASTVAFLTQPFWVYSPVPRAVVDERSGRTVFEIGPTAWALAIVDRGTELVIRHDDGRVGVLRDLAGITRG